MIFLRHPALAFCGAWSFPKTGSHFSESCSMQHQPAWVREVPATRGSCRHFERATRCRPGKLRACGMTVQHRNGHPIEQRRYVEARLTEFELLRKHTSQRGEISDRDGRIPGFGKRPAPSALRFPPKQ